MKKLIVLVVVIVLLLSFTSCQTPSPTSVPQEVNLPTEISSPTSTPVPTKTPVPTATDLPPTPTVAPPSVLVEHLDNVQIIEFDDFSSLDNWEKWNPGTGIFADKMFKITGQADYMSGLQFKKNISQGYGIVLKYKMVNNADFKSTFVFVTGNFQTDSFRQFGINNGKYPKTELFQGKNSIGNNNLIGNFSLKADTWYNILMAIGKKGEFLAVIWNPDDPSQQIIYHETIGSKWANFNYKFQAKANLGETVFIDDFMKISFDAIK